MKYKKGQKMLKEKMKTASRIYFSRLRKWKMYNRTRHVWNKIVKVYLFQSMKCLYIYYTMSQKNGHLSV